MKWIDSHCHVDFKNFNKDRDQVMTRIQDDLEFIINVAAEKKSNPKILEMAHQNSFVYGVLGLHPHDAADLDEDFLKFMERHIKHPKIVAVGEIGLDFYKNHCPQAIQKKTFEALTKLAVKNDMPIVIHSREAIPETLKILDELGAKEAVFHCFTGNQKEAEMVLERGYYISFSGVITFGKDTELQRVVKNTPADRFFVETDAPFLTPVPFRGKRNEPAYVKYVGEAAAKLKGMSAKELATQTSENVKKFFRID